MEFKLQNIKKFFYYLKNSLKYKYTFKEKFLSYEEAMKTQKMSKKNYNIFLNNYFKNRANIFYDETKVKTYGRFKFFLDFVNKLKKNKLKIFEVGGGSNPIISYIRKYTKIEAFSYILEVEKFVYFIDKKIPKKYKKKIKYITSYNKIKLKKFDLVYFGSSFQYVKNIDKLLNYIFKNKIKYIVITDIFLTSEKKGFFVVGYNDKPLVMPNQFHPFDKLILKFKNYNYSLLKAKKSSAENYTHSSIDYNTYAKYSLIFTKN